jgi:hypothetical protein
MNTQKDGDAMAGKATKKKLALKNTRSNSFVDKRKTDRRRLPSKGFTYISQVGWICRREQCRRCDDTIDTCYLKDE